MGPPLVRVFKYYFFREIQTSCFVPSASVATSFQMPWLKPLFVLRLKCHWPSVSTELVAGCGRVGRRRVDRHGFVVEGRRAAGEADNVTDRAYQRARQHCRRAVAVIDLVGGHEVPVICSAVMSAVVVAVDRSACTCKHPYQSGRGPR